ncbi:hypothetical protein B0A48_01132 [Cryoendolithus antarcticus]|uniref:Yeast cell wall synthesis Kre9/Knh1-like N-terminal domain-containing protein n=1 Tax=Cryoendolithus antarcticus TaxID=1507870 RepID=A0A1V8TSB6_9PEZI|nr:hypothetical protein B0A48_01132 [Cryoendolithus antarcticus]
MSIKSILTVFAAGLAFASAYTKPTGDAPEGNPISQPGLNSIVPAGENFTVTWKPTTDGTVSLILLKGPATDLKLVYPIAEKIKNSGSFVWDPKTDLEPGTTGYGIQLIDDATGQYQYTTQFGISNDKYHERPAGYSSWAATATGTAWGPSDYTTATATESSSASSSSASMSISATMPSNATVTTTTVKPYGTGVLSGYPAGNTTVIAPTGSMTVPTSLYTSATRTASKSSSTAGAASATSAIPAPTSSSNGAGSIAVSFGSVVLAAGLAVFAF